MARERFEHLLFLDAVEFGTTAGSVVFLDASAIAARFPQISTHKISLAVLSLWAEANGAKAWLLGVQPGSIKPGQRLTEIVETTLDTLRLAAKPQAAAIAAADRRQPAARGGRL